MLDIIVIGGGPAGLTSAIYARRAGLSVLVIEKEHFGGQISDSPKVSNYPGFKTISGLELSNNMFDQAMELGAEFEMDTVTSISKENDVFTVKTEYGQFQSLSVIIAAGVKHRKLNAMNEDRLLGKGVSYCAVCDGDFYRGKNTIVIGDANSALQYALMLSSICPNVTICTLFDKFFAEDMLVQALVATPNIEIVHNVSAISFNGETKLETVTFEHTVTKEIITVCGDAVFIAIGQVPDNEKYVPYVNLEKGFITTDGDMATMTPGLFAAGDCRYKKVKQVATAINDGAIAEQSAQNYLISLKNRSNS